MGRRNPALVTRPVRHEARQDEDHAGDTDDVGQVLDPEAVDVIVGRVGESQAMDGDIERAADGHHPQAKQHQGRESAREAERLYHQHSLEIHLRRGECQVYSQSSCVIDSST